MGFARRECCRATAQPPRRDPEPGLRTAGVGTLSALATDGTSPNRSVWYWTATLPVPVRHGDAPAAQEEIGQSLASTRRESSPLTPEPFHVSGSDTSWI
jgi:hypothetical protein